MTARPKQHGFVLLMTLIILTLLSISAGELARTSLSKALEAQGAERDLQRRWSTLSASTTALEKAEEGLAAAQANSFVPVHRLTWKTNLSGGTLRFVVDDEQAKLDINSLLQKYPKSEAEQILRKLVTPTMSHQIRLRPSQDKESKIEDLSQIFKNTQLRTSDHFAHLADGTENVTCWGTNRTNILRASETVLQEWAHVNNVTYSEISALLNARAERPNSSLSELLAIAKIDTRTRYKISRQLTDQSQIWTCLLEWDDGQRRWFSHDVSQKSSSLSRNLGGNRFSPTQRHRSW